MGYTQYLKRVLFRDSNGNGYVIPVSNLVVWYEPWHASGSTSVRLFHGKNVTRIQGYQGFCTFDMNFGYEGIDDATLSSFLNAVSDNTSMTIDFDPDSDPGNKTMTVILDDVRGGVGAAFNGKVRNRPVRLKFIDPIIRATIPDWAVGSSDENFLIAFLAENVSINEIQTSLISSFSFSTFLVSADPASGTTYDISDMRIGYSEGVVYWSQLTSGGTGRLYKASYNKQTGAIIGSETQLTTEGSTEIRGIAVGTGAYSDYLYYSTGSNFVKRIGKDGTGKTTLYSGLSNPNNMVLNPANGNIIITLTGIGKIVRGNVDTLVAPSTILDTSQDYDHCEIDFANDKIWVRIVGGSAIKVDTYSTMATNGSTLTDFIANVGTGAQGCTFAIGSAAGLSNQKVYFWDNFIKGAGTPDGIYSQNYDLSGYTQELNSTNAANFECLQLG